MRLLTILIIALYASSAKPAPTSTENLINTYGKEAIMKEIAHKVGNKYTIYVDGATRLAHAPRAEFITAWTLATDIERAGMTVKSLEKIFIDRAALAESKANRIAAENQRILELEEKQRQDRQKYRDEDIEFFATASESEREQFKQAQLNGLRIQEGERQMERFKNQRNATRDTESRQPQPAGIGVTYEQAMQGLNNDFIMKSSPLNDGRERYLGRPADGMAVLEIIGQKNNISGIHIMLGTPKDSDAILRRNATRLAHVLINTVPEWNSASEWASRTLSKLSHETGDSSESIVNSNKTITIKTLKSLGMILVSIN